MLTMVCHYPCNGSWKIVGNAFSMLSPTQSKDDQLKYRVGIFWIWETNWSFNTGKHHQSLQKTKGYRVLGEQQKYKFSYFYFEFEVEKAGD